MAEHSPLDLVRHASTWSIIWGILLIVFGVLAIGSPFLAAVAVSAVIAWLIILAGVVHVILAFHIHRASSMIWKLLVGLAYLFFGVYLLMHPALAVASLTLVLASLFLIEGILDIILFFQMQLGVHPAEAGFPVLWTCRMSTTEKGCRSLGFLSMMTRGWCTCSISS